MQRKFRKPSEMKPLEKRVPISSRVRHSLRAELTKHAKGAKLSLAEFIENILEDYSKFLSSESQSQTDSSKSDKK